jgi:hypothetical protein
MTHKNWKEAAEIVGVIAIVLSLIFVAYELRQNTLMMRAQINQSRTEVEISPGGRAVASGRKSPLRLARFGDLQRPVRGEPAIKTG